MTFVKKDLWIYYSVELSAQYNVAIGAVCRPLFVEGRQGDWVMVVDLGGSGDLVSLLKVI